MKTNARYFLVRMNYPLKQRTGPSVREIAETLRYTHFDGVHVSALPIHAVEAAKQAKTEGPYPDHVIDAYTRRELVEAVRNARGDIDHCAAVDKLIAHCLTERS